MSEIVTSLLILIGVVFLLAGSLGVARLRDFYGRMHAAGKASTMGIIFVTLGTLWHFTAYYGSISAKPLLITAFIFLTAPVGTHMMSKAGYFSGVPLWKGTFINEMDHNGRGHHEKATEE
ncbi:MAG: monovalent cation/H(+) antiporter subunit G [Bacillota bacterium]